MTQRDRDRLKVLEKVSKRLIGQAQAALEVGLSVRQVKRLVKRFRQQGDQAVVHGLRGRPSWRKLTAARRDKIVRILSEEQYRGFGPTLAAEYLREKHGIQIGREALRQIMIKAGLWRAHQRKVDQIHQWRPRRSCRGELVQWDTSEHDWLEGRGEKLYLIAMIDDASSQLTASFVRHDSTEENLRLLRRYLEQHGRPLAFYTDKASLFHTTVKRRRDRPGEEVDAVEMPPTQIGRALRELGIAWIAAHSPQAKGRIERSFATAQDRLVKGLRIARAQTIEQANRYLEEEFLAWWNQHLQVQPAHAADAHRALSAEHDLAAILSCVHTPQVGNDYTIRFHNQRYRILRQDVRAGMRGSLLRLEQRLDGTLHARWGDRYVTIELCPPALPAAPPNKTQPVSRRHAPHPPPPSPAYRQGVQDLASKGGIPVWKAARIDRTRTRDVTD